MCSKSELSRQTCSERLVRVGHAVHFSRGHAAVYLTIVYAQEQTHSLQNDVLRDVYKSEAAKAVTACESGSTASVCCVVHAGKHQYNVR